MTGSPFPKGDNKDDSHIFMRFLLTYLPEDPKIFIRVYGAISGYRKSSVMIEARCRLNSSGRSSIG